MQSKTSFCNLTLMKRNMTRFWPLWAVYFAAYTLLLPILLAVRIFSPLNTAASITPAMVQRNIYNMSTEVGLVISMTAGVVIAMAVLSYLYSARSAGFMHSLPITRAGLFFSNYLSGLLFMIIPNLAVLLLTIAVTAAGGINVVGAALTWFLMVSGMELFFYSFAFFCGAFTGQLLVLPVIYAILNFLVSGMHTAFSSLGSNFIYGYARNASNFWDYLSPPVGLASNLNITNVWSEPPAGVAQVSELVSCNISGGGTVLGYAVAGLVFAALAYVALCKRNSETAGDAISFSWAKILFKLGVGFCVAFTLGLLIFQTLTTQFIGRSNNALALVVCTLITGVIGYYAAQMFLEKTFRVLHNGKKCLLILVALILAVCTTYATDVFGYEKSVPQQDQIKSVNFVCSGYNYMDATVYAPENIQLAANLHKMIVDQKQQQEKLYNEYTYTEGDRSYSGNIRFAYTMSDGSVVKRSYNLIFSEEEVGNLSTITGAANSIVCTTEFIQSSILRNLEAEEISKASIQYIDEYYNWQDLNLNRDEWIPCYNAAVVDIANGAATKELFYDSEAQNTLPYGTIYIQFDADGGGTSYFQVTDAMTNLSATLDNLGIASRIGK